MIKFSPDRNLDEVDRAMLRLLQEDGRMSITELAQRISLSPAATHARLRALEAQKYIASYTAVLDPEKLGYDFTCFIQISFKENVLDTLGEFLDKIRAMPEVVECYKVTGEYDCIMKVMVRSHRDLDRFLTENLNRMAGVARTHTSVSVNDVKIHGAIPIPSG